MRYFLVSFYRKAGGQIDEQVRLVKRVRTSDYTTSNIILDFANKKVEKCVVEGKKLERTFDDIVNYYKKYYPSFISQLEKEALITQKEKTGK
jgi:hypothetical protein